MAASAAKFRAWCEGEAEKAEAGEDEDTKTAVFLASGSVSGKGATCFHCGLSANHKTSVCRKSEDISAEEAGKSASKQSAAGSASTRLLATAMNALLCVPNVARPDTSQLATSTTRRILELYDRIRKESRKRKRKGSSASGPSSAKKSKPASKEDNKDLKNQLEKARLDGMREGLEKTEASLSSSPGSSKLGGGRGRGRGKGRGGKQQGQGKAATDSTPKKEKD